MIDPNRQLLNSIITNIVTGNVLRTSGSLDKGAKASYDLHAYLESGKTSDSGLPTKAI